jgi:hypothetical protein
MTHHRRFNLLAAAVYTAAFLIVVVYLFYWRPL